MAKPVILCIDDEKSILDSLESQLQSEFSSEFRIELAESAEEGREIIEENMANQVEIPVILVDYLMPDMKGDQFLIWAHDKMPETRNIMLLGQAGLEAVASAVNHANLYRYIAKPWDKNDLILTIKKAVASFRQQQTIQSQNTDLQLLNIQLQQMNKDLDERVAERTRDYNRQKALFRQIFDNSPDGMVIVDAAEKIIEVNKTFTDMFQYTAHEIIGCCLPDIVVSGEYEESARLHEKISVGDTVQRETRRQKKDGKSVPILLTMYPLFIDDDMRGAIVIYHDLTIQRETADLLQRSYERRKRSDFFNGLAVNEKSIRNETYVQAKLLGINLKGPFLLFFLRLTEWKSPSVLPVQDKETGARILIDRIIDRLSEKTELYAWDSQAGIGILYMMPENHKEEIQTEKQIAQSLLRTVSGDFPEVAFTLGIAEFWPGMERFAERYKQSRIVALIGPKIHPDHCVHHYWDIGAFPLLSRLIDDEESERFLERTIGKLRKYDSANGTDLFHTLERITAHDSLRTVADEMFIHYKTIIFRKQSIEKILGISLDSFEGRTIIGTAMTLYFFQGMKDII